MVLLRSLLEDTDLMTYFACYPEQAADWRQRLSRAPVWTDEVYRQGIRKFRMPHIWKMLRAKAIEPLGERDYSILSATVHASPWGARFYGRSLPGDPGAASTSAWHRSTTQLRLSQQALCSRGHTRGRFTRSFRFAPLLRLPGLSGAQSRHATMPSSRIGRPR